jgi:putative ABC transport system substrate-binding protein
MRRRDFIKVSAGSVIAWPLAARAQNSGKLFRIGFLGSTSANGLRERFKAFRDGLRVLGHEEGRDIVIEARWADGHYERLPMLLADLIASKVDVIVTPWHARRSGRQASDHDDSNRCRGRRRCTELGSCVQSRQT